MLNNQFCNSFYEKLIRKHVLCMLMMSHIKCCKYWGHQIAQESYRLQRALLYWLIYVGFSFKIGSRIKVDSFCLFQWVLLLSKIRSSYVCIRSPCLVLYLKKVLVLVLFHSIVLSIFTNMFNSNWNRNIKPLLKRKSHGKSYSNTVSSDTDLS